MALNVIQKKVLCSADKSSVICAEPHSRSSAEQFVRTERSVNHYPVYKNYKGFSDKLSYNHPIIIYSALSSSVAQESIRGQLKIIEVLWGARICAS